MEDILVAIDDLLVVTQEGLAKDELRAIRQSVENGSLSIEDRQYVLRMHKRWSSKIAHSDSSLAREKEVDTKPSCNKVEVDPAFATTIKLLIYASIIIFFALLLYPDEASFKSDFFIDYRMVRYCDKANNCVEKVASPVLYKVDEAHKSVVVQDVNSKALNEINHCIIKDSKNWSCVGGYEMADETIQHGWEEYYGMEHVSRLKWRAYRLLTYFDKD